MRVLVDAVAVREGSAAVVVGQLLAGWAAVAPEDELIVLAADTPKFVLPLGARLELLTPGSSALGRLWAQSLGVRRASRKLKPDALIGGVTASALLGACCPYGVIVYDLRHELRPGQFSLRRRLVRRLAYGWSFRRADALFCISERTRRDVLTRRPRLRSKTHVALLGADHAAGWRARAADDGRYVLAFGRFANKNVGLVLRAWRAYADGRRHGLSLRLCGLGGETRSDAERLVAELQIEDRVELLPWLSDEEFAALFAGAAAVLLPSDFEGFGLPAVEALLLGRPLVISQDPALLEVTGGHAVVARDGSPDSLASAIDEALQLTPERLAAGVQHARRFTWERTARRVREVLARSSGGEGSDQGAQGAHCHMPVSSR